MVKRIDIIQIVQAAVTNDDGAAVFNVLIRELKDSDVILSFRGISTATSSFVNSSFVQLLDNYPLDTIKSKIKIIESSRQINEMIKKRINAETNRSLVA
jgi:hypothetical protein